jgi:NADPH:quinone reductase
MANDTVRAVVVTRSGGPEVLEVRDIPTPRPGPGDLLVEVGASGVNFIDVYQREGRYPMPLPFVLGTECAGRVLAAGSDGDGPDGFAVGDLVATASPGTGSHATVALVPAEQAVPVPDGVDVETAAAAMLQGMTAHYLTTSTYAVQPGDAVLVHAAAGGVGQLLVQRVKSLGARVVATVGSADKAEIAAALGADAVLRYDRFDTSEALAAAVREASGGGVQVAYDGVGKATFDASLASLRRRGMLVLYGAASGAVPPFDLQRLNAAGSLFVTRPMLWHYTATREELLWRASETFSAIAAGSLHIAIGGRYPLDRAADAYRDLEARRTTGKLLIIP